MKKLHCHNIVLLYYYFSHVSVGKQCVYVKVNMTVKRLLFCKRAPHMIAIPVKSQTSIFLFPWMLLNIM